MRVHTIWLFDYLYVREKKFQSQNIFKKFLSVQSDHWVSSSNSINVLNDQKKFQKKIQKNFFKKDKFLSRKISECRKKFKSEIMIIIQD